MKYRYIITLSLTLFSFSQLSGQVINHILEYNSFILGSHIKALYIDGTLIAPKSYWLAEPSQTVHVRTGELAALTPPLVYSKIVECNEEEYGLQTTDFIPSDEYYKGIKLQNEEELSGRVFLVYWDIEGNLVAGLDSYEIRGSVPINKNGTTLMKSGFVISLQSGMEGFQPYLHGFYNHLDRKICKVDLTTTNVDEGQINADNNNSSKDKPTKKKKNKDRSKKATEDIQIYENDRGSIKRFRKGALFGYIKKDLILIPAQYTSAEPFRRRKASVCKGSNCYIINTKGECVKNCP